MLDALQGSHSGGGSVTLHRLSLRGKKWKYRGEGNANLVIALPSDRLIIRLRKQEKAKQVTAEEERAQLKRMWREVLFCCKMMVPLLGRAYIQPPIPAFMDKGEVNEIDETLMTQRPVFRRHKGIRLGHLTIYPDYALLPIYLSERNQPASPPKLIPSNNQIHDKNTENLRSDYFRSTSFHDPVFDENKEAVKTLLKISSLYSLHFEQHQNDNENNLNILMERPNFPIDSSQISCSVNRLDMFYDNASRKDINDFSTQNYSSSLDYSSPIASVMKQTPSPRHNYHSQFSQVKRIVDYSTYCVELKPKQGWIPPIDRRFTKCTFCLNQYLKVLNGSVKTHSLYCPLDLFSGNRIRMKSAVKSLLTTPQNNLKIFKDGQLVFGDETNCDVFGILKSWLDPSPDVIEKEVDTQRLEEKFSNLVVDTLTRDLTVNESRPRISDDNTFDAMEFKENVPERIPLSLISTVASLLPKESCDWSAKDLPSNCILKRILEIQQLEKYGADAIYDLYRREHFNEMDDYAHVRAIQGSAESDGSSKSLSFDPIQRYLLATTAKDCSILISFQRLHKPSKERIPSCHVVQDSDNDLHVFNIGVSDLDPKPMSSIEKHKKRDCDVISACLKLLSSSAES